MAWLAPLLPYGIALAVLAGLYGSHKLAVALAHHEGVTAGVAQEKAALQPKLDAADSALKAAQQAVADYQRALKAKDDAYKAQAAGVAQLDAAVKAKDAELKAALAKLAASNQFYDGEIARLQAIATSPKPLTGDDCAKVDDLLRSVERSRLRGQPPH